MEHRTIVAMTIVCMECTMLSMVWEGCERRVSIESAMRAPTPTPWYMVPRVYTRPDLCLFRKAASPEVKGRIQGRSDWQVVQELVALSAAVLYPRQASKQYERDDSAPWVQPFDMPMAHVEVSRPGCPLVDTELVVFVPTDDEVTPSLWQRFQHGPEDDLEARDLATHIMVAWAVPKNKKAVEPMRLTCGRFSYEGQGIQDATSMMVKDEHNVITYDCAAACHGLDFGDARIRTCTSRSPKGTL